MGKLVLLSKRKESLYFLKTKTTSSYKLIYLKRNKLTKIWLCIFSPVLVENIEFKVTKVIYIQMTTIL